MLGNLLSNRNKVSLISDKSELENSIGIALTETWVNCDISDAELYKENFDLFRADRDDRSRGGTAIYLNSDLNCKQIFISLMEQLKLL